MALQKTTGLFEEPYLGLSMLGGVKQNSLHVASNAGLRRPLEM